MRRWGRLSGAARGTEEAAAAGAATSAAPSLACQKVPEEDDWLPTAQCADVPINPKISLSFRDKVRRGLRVAAPTARRRPLAAKRAETQPAGSVLVWLRPFDLRLHDQPALFHAAQSRKAVHLIFAWSEEDDVAEGEWQLAGTAAAFFLHHAVASLDMSIQTRYGNTIRTRRGSSLAEAVLAAAQEAGAEEVLTSSAVQPTGPQGLTVDREVARALESAGIKLRTFDSFLLYDIKQVKIDLGTYRGHFGTLTPFHSACFNQPPVGKPVPEPSQLPAPRQLLRDDGLETLGFAEMPQKPDKTVLNWGIPILESWDISESAALQILRRFLADGLRRYEAGRQLADASAVTRISPYLRFGMLSPRLMFHEMKAAGAKEASIVYWRRLVWRDLAYWQLQVFPEMRSRPIRAHYEGQAWNTDPTALRRWQRGQTGFPLIDAGMRELWTTGWMAQNVRMAAAILLCEHLNIHWIEGERWFHHTLVDADQAINPMMWQNAGKSGLDQWNFTMHAASAGKTQDPKGHYIRRWCPELSKLPTQFVHAPWDAPAHVLEAAGVRLGPEGNYPHRIVVDLHAAAKRSAEAIREQRKRSSGWINDQGYDLIVIPRGASVAHDGQKFRVFTKPEYRNPRTSSGWNEEGGKGGRAKGRGKGRQRAQQNAESEWHYDSEWQAAAAWSSNHGVLDEYMRAWGG